VRAREVDGHGAATRIANTAALLFDGQVLVTGGIDSNGNDLVIAELY